MKGPCARIIRTTSIKATSRVAGAPTLRPPPMSAPPASQSNTEAGGCTSGDCTRGTCTMEKRQPKCTCDYNIYSALLAIFSPVVRPPSFGLGRGPTTPPDPAMVRTSRKDLNSKRKEKKESCDYIFGLFGYFFLRWFAHIHLALRGVQLPLPVLQWSEWTEAT